MTDDSSALIISENIRCSAFANGQNGKQSIGRLLVFNDKVVWQLKDRNNESIGIDFDNIRGQRVSLPNKTKAKLQLCLHEGAGDPVSFVFVNPNLDAVELRSERDLIKDAIQQSLIKHRALANELAKKCQQEKTHLGNQFEQKQRLLRQNPRLQALYQDLVSTNLIGASEFWTDYVEKPNDSQNGKSVGVSAGFLSTLTETDGCNRIKLNLTPDTIEAIFRIYPSVRKKHLDLVPYEMTEKDFWLKFFQSHYFHRDRTVNPTETFADCLKLDESDMKAIVDAGVSRTNYDLGSVSDDLGFALDEDMESLVRKGNSGHAALVKRFNYHSGRVLKVCLDGDNALASNLKIIEINGKSQNSTTAKKARIEDAACCSTSDITLDSQDLADQIALIDNQTIDINPIGGKRDEDDKDQSASKLKIWKETVRKILNKQPQIFDVEFEDSSYSPVNSLQYRAIESSVTISKELDSLNRALSELLRHFWCCFPPKSPELEQKLNRMAETLQKFESTKLQPAIGLVGSKNLSHMMSMLHCALKKFDSYKQKKQAKR